MFAIIKTRWQTRPLSRRAKRRSSAAPASLRKKYAGIPIPQTWYACSSTLPHLGITGSRYKLAILRPHSISAALLTAYLLSPTGQALLLRRNRGSVQQGVVLPDVRTFPVPKFSDRLTTKVEKAMHESATEKQRADFLYPEAETELLDRMDWKALQLPPVE